MWQIMSRPFLDFGLSRRSWIENDDDNDDNNNTDGDDDNDNNEGNDDNHDFKVEATSWLKRTQTSI